MSIAESVEDLKVWIQRAVLGHITPNLRGISGYRENGCLNVLYYFRSSALNEDREMMSFITVELLAHTDDNSVSEKCCVIDEALPLPTDLLIYEC